MTVLQSSLEEADTVADKSEANGKIRQLSRDEARALFDLQARRLLGMSGDEFIRAWESGQLDDQVERPEVARVAMLIPLGR